MNARSRAANTTTARHRQTPEGALGKQLPADDDAAARKQLQADWDALPPEAQRVTRSILGELDRLKDPDAADRVLEASALLLEIPIPRRVNDPAIGERVRLLREQKRWKQSELAAKANVGINTVSGLESGRKTHWTKFVQIAVALGTTPEAIQRGDASEVPHDLTPEDLTVARQFHHAPTNIRVAVLDLLRNQERGDFNDRIARLSLPDQELIRSQIDGLDRSADTPDRQAG